MVETLLGIQIVALAFCLFMLYLTFVHYKRKNLGSGEFIFWVLAWCTVLFFALFPRVLDPVISRLFVTRVLDLVMLGGFVILSYLGFQNHIGIKDLQKRVEQLVRKQTLNDAKKKK